MTNTALGAKKKEVTRTIIFKDKEHENFYHEYLQKCRYQDAYHKALVYCLGLSEDTRVNVERIYDFETGLVQTSCLGEGWQTVVMPNTFGKRLKFGIRNIVFIKKLIGRQCMLKIRLQGTTGDIKWLTGILKRDKRVDVLEVSEPFANKGTNRYFRVYAEVEKSKKL